MPIVKKRNYGNNFMVSFCLGYAVTVTAGVVSYPLQTIRRRMMMTSGEAVKYKTSLHAFRTIIAKEGVTALFKGVGVNLLSGVLGAFMLPGFDRLKHWALQRRETQN